jgi:hypothetical protein
MTDRKLQASAVVCLMIATTLAFASDTNVQNEQTSRLTAIKTRAANNQLTVGDMHESGAHLRVVAARLRDLGKTTALDNYIRDKANSAKLIANCMASGHHKPTQAQCQADLAMIQTNGTDTMLQAVAAVAYNVSLWGRPIPVEYQGGARLVPVLRMDCGGANEAIRVVGIIGAAALVTPGAEPAGGVTMLFWAILDFAAYEWC